MQPVIDRDIDLPGVQNAVRILPPRVGGAGAAISENGIVGERFRDDQQAGATIEVEVECVRARPVARPVEGFVAPPTGRQRCESTGIIERRDQQSLGRPAHEPFDAGHLARIVGSGHAVGLEHPDAARNDAPLRGDGTGRVAGLDGDERARARVVHCLTADDNVGTRR